jgi:hypothetical protein
LEAPGSLARTVANEREGIAQKIRVGPASRKAGIVREQLNPVVDRRNWSD